MLPKLKTRIIALSQIQVARSRMRRNNMVTLRQAVRVIRKDGQQRPLVVDPDGRLLSDTTSYLALKDLNYELVKVVVTPKDPSPALVRAIGRLLERCEAVRYEAVAFNAVLSSLDTILQTGMRELVLDLLPVVIDKTGVVSLRLEPALASDEGRRTPLNG